MNSRGRCAARRRGLTVIKIQSDRTVRADKPGVSISGLDAYPHEHVWDRSWRREFRDPMLTVEDQSSIAATRQRVGVVAADGHALAARRNILTARAFARWTETVTRDRSGAAVTTVERRLHLVCGTRNRPRRRSTSQSITRRPRRMTSGRARVTVFGHTRWRSDGRGSRCRRIHGADRPSRRATCACTGRGHRAEHDYTCARSEVHDTFDDLAQRFGSIARPGVANWCRARGWRHKVWRTLECVDGDTAQYGRWRGRGLRCLDPRAPDEPVASA